MIGLEGSSELEIKEFEEVVYVSTDTATASVSGPTTSFGINLEKAGSQRSTDDTTPSTTTTALASSTVGIICQRSTVDTSPSTIALLTTTIAPASSIVGTALSTTTLAHASTQNTESLLQCTCHIILPGTF
ncbi:hypothetical protein ACH5RR_022520 [Cinchona calisaya]|uniref:Uncharacterized protein n=1 Tax=Cinchona calisaya TaxID=153742 RepID=A0ABD2Z922_9GENT